MSTILLRVSLYDELVSLLTKSPGHEHKLVMIRYLEMEIASAITLDEMTKNYKAFYQCIKRTRLAPAFQLSGFLLIVHYLST